MKFTCGLAIPTAPYLSLWWLSYSTIENKRYFVFKLEDVSNPWTNNRPIHPVTFHRAIFGIHLWHIYARHIQHAIHYPRCMPTLLNVPTQSRHSHHFIGQVNMALASCRFPAGRIYLQRNSCWKSKTVEYCLLYHVNCSSTITLTSHDRRGVSNNQSLDCLSNSLFKLTSKETSKACVTGLLWGKSMGDRWIPITKGSNVENVSMCWHHHDSTHFDPFYGDMDMYWVGNSTYCALCDVITHLCFSQYYHGLFDTPHWFLWMYLSGPLFTKKTPFYRYMNPRYKPATVWRPSQVLRRRLLSE